MDINKTLKECLRQLYLQVGKGLQIVKHTPMKTLNRVWLHVTVRKVKHESESKEFKLA